MASGSPTSLCPLVTSTQVLPPTRDLSGRPVRNATGGVRGRPGSRTFVGSADGWTAAGAQRGGAARGPGWRGSVGSSSAAAALTEAPAEYVAANTTSGTTTGTAHSFQP